MDEDFIGGKPVTGFTADNHRVVVNGKPLGFEWQKPTEDGGFKSIETWTELTDLLVALEADNEALRKRVDRLYSHIGLRG